MKTLTLLGSIIAGMLTLCVLTAGMAAAGSDDLECLGGFSKVRTYEDSIKCRWTKTGYPTKRAAEHSAGISHKRAECNGRMGTPKSKAYTDGRNWKARVTFICETVS